jgi:hypothetical protein
MGNTKDQSVDSSYFTWSPCTVHERDAELLDECAISPRAGTDDYDGWRYL